MFFFPPDKFHVQLFMTKFVDLRNDTYVQKEYPIELSTIGQYKHSVKWYAKQPDLTPEEFIFWRSVTDNVRVIHC